MGHWEAFHNNLAAIIIFFRASKCVVTLECAPSECSASKTATETIARYSTWTVPWHCYGFEYGRDQ